MDDTSRITDMTGEPVRAGVPSEDVTVVLLEGGQETSREKSKVCRDVMAALPDWFGGPEADREPGRQVRELPMFIARAKGRAVGFLTVKAHPPAAVEVLLMGVLPDWHGRGVGRVLIAAVTAHAADLGARYLTVKTIGETHPSEHFAATRAFYRAAGFVPLEELADFFGKGQPCLYMVKALN